MDNDAIAERLRVAFRFLVRRAETVSGDGAPTRAELDAMVRLDEAGNLTPGALATMTRVRPQTMGQTLDLLDRHGWLRREPDPDDRRRVRVSLSPAGRKALQRGRALRQAWLSQEIARLSPGERRSLAEAVAVLERIARAEPPL